MNSPRATNDASAMAARVSARVVDDGNCLERVGFFIKGAPQVFSKVSLPHDPEGVVVVVPTLATDFRRWFGRIESLTDQLVSSGIAVLSFDFRGEGFSGPIDDRTTETLVVDIESAIREASDIHGRVASVGVGFGALLLSAYDSAVPSFGWGASPSGDAFVFELFSEVLEGRMGIDSSRDPALLDAVVSDVIARELATTGRIDLGGFQIEESLYRSICAISCDGLVSQPTPFDERTDPDVVARVVVSILLGE